MVEKKVSRKVQKSRDPFCPPQSAATVYCKGSVELE
jgi:hypothetical protein